MAGSLWWLALYVSLALATFFNGVIGHSTTSLLSMPKVAVQVMTLCRACGALVVGRLLDTRGARWCLFVTVACSVAYCLFLSLSWLRLAALGPLLFFSPVSLVLLIVAVKESSASNRAYVLGHTTLAMSLGQRAGTAMAKGLLTALGGPRAKALIMGGGYLILLPLLLRLVGGSGGFSDLPREGAADQSRLPSPVSGRSGSPSKDDSPRPVVYYLKAALSQPALLQLVLLQLLARSAERVKINVGRVSHTTTDFKLGELIGLGVLIGLGISKLTPQAFACLCLVCKASTALCVAFVLATWSKDDRFASTPLWLGLSVLEHVGDKALEVVWLWFLTSGVPREHRGFMMGLSRFLTIPPSLLPPFLPWKASVYMTGDVAVLYVASAVMHLLLLIQLRKLVLPLYRQKDD